MDSINIFTELADYKKLVRLISQRNSIDLEIHDIKKKLDELLNLDELHKFKEILEALLSKKGNCVKCGMLIVGEFSNQKSKQVEDQCFSCAGDEKLQAGEEQSYVARSRNQV